MGDGGRFAGRDALDEMGRVVAALLAAVGDAPPAEEPTPAHRVTVPERTAELPDLAELDGLLAGAEAGWTEWRMRLAELRRRVEQPAAG